MKAIYQDVLEGSMFVVGIVGFISGEFIVSSVLFASAAVSSNMNLNRQPSPSSKFVSLFS